MKLNLKQLVTLLLAYFPRALPIGLTSYNEFAARVITLTGPLADELSLRWTLSNKIMQLDPGVAYKSDMYFVRHLRKAAANQVAAYVVEECKAKQAEAIKKAAEQQSVEDTTAQQVGPSTNEKTA